MEFLQRMHCVRYLSGFLLCMCSFQKKKKKDDFTDNDIFLDLDSGLCYTIKYGEQMRAWIDVGYSTAEDH